MKALFLICLCFLFSTLPAAPAAGEKSVCLNMIVKNESQVIEKCLASVKPLIDYWVIVDTGSDDNTRQIIKEYMKDIPGELHERPWVNFSHNRNEALNLAKSKGDYVLIIDADEVLQYSNDFKLPTLDKDLYLIPLRQVGVVDVKRNGIHKSTLNWSWKGDFHEVIESPEVKTSEVLKGIVNLCNTHPEGNSGRSKESNRTKYLRDAEGLKKSLEKDPTNSRYVFYLGISYAAADQHELAKKSFEKRVSMPSSDHQETYWALYNLGLMQEKLNEPDAALETFSKAFAFRSIRAEPLFQMGKIYRKKGNLLMSYLLFKHALSIPYPEGDSCVEYVVYDHQMLIEFANCALLMGKFKEGLDVCIKLLANPNLPAEYKNPLQSNYELALKNVQQTTLN